MIKRTHQRWFDQLHKENSEAAIVFKRPQFANVFRGVIDKYSDSAHFIYELLQNADDAGATKVTMRLERNKFIFTHNGTVRFTVSDPENIVADREAGRLGHINSICYIGFSSKSGADIEANMQNKIGKFGVGFKAVFQYTTTPEVYDDPFCFRIDDYIVPTAIENPQDQEKGHTVFVIPFNRKDITAKRAYEEISQKLRDLSFPQLFLNHIQTISWETPEQKNNIVKALDAEGYSHNIKYGLYSLSNSINKEKKKILLLSRTVSVPGQGSHDVTIGYYIDRGRIQTRESQNIHCFFPTNENIGTCYVIHAPFALVDNRQQIKRNNEVNEFLFKSIAKLAADSLLVLRDWDGYDKVKLLNDNILKLIRYNTESYDQNRYYDTIGEYFENSYEDILNEQAVYLCRSGEYLTKAASFWAPEEVRTLFTDEQIDSMLDFSNRNYDEDDEDEYYEYDADDIEVQDSYGIVLSNTSYREFSESPVSIRQLDGERLAKLITTEFMESQPKGWIERFYDYVIKRRLIEVYEINRGQRSEAPMRRASIVKVQNGKFIAPYDSNGKLQVFFADEVLTTPDNSINQKLYDSSAIFRDLLKRLNVKAPDQLDTLRIQLNRHDTKVQNGESIPIVDINDLTIKIISYYQSCSLNQRKELLELIRNISFILYDSNNDASIRLAKPEDIYSDDEILREYFSCTKLNKNFFARQYYAKAIAAVGEDIFNDFFNNFAFIKFPKIITETQRLTSEDRGLCDSYRIYQKEFPSMEGLLNVLSSIEDGEGSKELSHFVWDLIIRCYNKDKQFFKNNISHYFYYTSRVQRWPYNSLIKELRNKKWLYVDEELKAISVDAYKEDLLENGYTFNAELFTLLEISSTPNIKEAEIISEMSEDTRETFALGQELKKAGISNIDEIKSMRERLEAYERKEKEEAIAQMERQARAERRKQEADAFNELPSRKKSSGVQASDFDAPDNERACSSKGKSSTAGKNIDEILEGFAEKAQIEREEFELVANLRDRIAQSEKYSYDWLTSLMLLEVKSQGGERAAGKKALYISFEHISVNPKNDRMIVLSGPSRYIPMSLEEMDDIPVTFVFKNGTQDTIKFESISVKEDSVILIHKADVIDTIKKTISSISYAFTEINEPIELLSEWQRRINALDFEPTDSIKANLRADIEFIFGPPGTGKTTTLARRINEIISGGEREMKILVLAPTNKACDVLTRKLLDVTDGDDTWIWRFEKTDDPYLEEQEVVYKRTCSVSDQRKVSVISTIARYAFDGFEDGYLRDLEWDYVFIDEASMIPLYQILPPLYNPLSKRIIVSGDPFQIEPIVNIDLWKGENIYKMINLHDFAHPTTEPVQFKVTTLMTQYRSIPAIGELFSSYLYGGKLRHNRTESQHRMLNMGIKESPLNIISFPVGKESIFDLKRLSGSNIQVYSVIFTIEFLKYITRNLNDNHKEDVEPIKIGVISPYAVQIQAIEKIYNQSCPFYDNIDVIFGSAHGFQGDQCDIIIAVMNPPASGLKRAADMTFINNKNILNVAISRASDYLFLLIPEKDYENFNSLYEIKKIGRKMNELGSEIYSNDIVENILFSEAMHIERITYVTSHKMTNVFNNPFTTYEIRIDENAIDIQINDL